jgi:hypothetical protein
MTEKLYLKKQVNKKRFCMREYESQNVHSALWQLVKVPIENYFYVVTVFLL